MKIIDNPLSSFKTISTNILWITSTLNMAWLGVPEDLRHILTEGYSGLFTVITIVLLVIGFLGRFIDQNLEAPVDDYNN